MVMVNNVLGNELGTKCSVPKASLLGLILFIMYINSICESKIDGSTITYADNTSLFFSDKSWKFVYTKAPTGRNPIIQKLNNKKIILNIYKTVFMEFSIYTFQLTFDEIQIANFILNPYGCIR